MFWCRAITVGAQRRTRGRSSHRRGLCIILVCCPVALVEIVRIYGVESMMGARGKGAVVVGMRHRAVRVEVAVIGMEDSGSGV